MTFLVIQLDKHQFKVVSPDTDGMETWGSRHQEGIERKDWKWCAYSWYEGYEGDVYDFEPLNVVYETKYASKAMDYIYRHGANKENREETNNQIYQIIKDAQEFGKW